MGMACTFWAKIAFCLVGGLVATAALAQDFGETVIKRGDIVEDVYAAGETVLILANVQGDVVAAGRRVTVENQVQEDVIAAGALVEIRGTVGDDVRAAGADVEIQGDIADDAIAAGGSVSVESSARVGGRAWLAGGAVEVAGTVAKELKVGAGEVTLSGTIEGDVELVGREIIILSTTRILGDLTYRSPAPIEIPEEAEIQGQVTHIPMGAAEGPGLLEAALFGVVAWLALIVVGAIFLGLFPQFGVRAAQTIASDPWKSLGLGLVMLVTPPFAAGLLMATVVGILAGLATLAMYFVWLLTGLIVGLVFLGNVGLARVRKDVEITAAQRLLALAVVTLVLAVLQLIPGIGQLIGLLVLLLGLGAWTLANYRVYLGARK